MNTKISTEGNVKVLVPIIDQNVPISISSASVFYNHHMELNRDISIATFAAYSTILSEKRKIATDSITYIDALAASGIRGIRVSEEIGLSVTLNDWNEYAYDLMIRNVELNNLSSSIQVKHTNANVLLHKERYNIVDIDPFGSVTTFLHAACNSVVDLLAVTATDTAPLCGAHLNSGIRKYSAIPLNLEYHSEMGLRILLGLIARDLARHEKSMSPLFCHVTRHYIRVYVQVVKSSKKADKTLKEMGYIAHCNRCSHRSLFYGLAVSIPKKCEFCSNDLIIAGPLWLGLLHDTDFCTQILQNLNSMNLGTKEKAVKIVELCKNELHNPTFYDQHLLTKQLGMSAISMEEFIEALKYTGYLASRTHFSGTSFKTNANILQILDVLNKFR